MSTLGIPEAAIGAAWHELRYPRPATDAPSESLKRALAVAAPHIVVAVLEGLAVEVDGARAGRADDWDRGWHAALDYVSRIIRRSVSELHGEGAK